MIQASQRLLAAQPSGPDSAISDKTVREAGKVVELFTKALGKPTKLIPNEQDERAGTVLWKTKDFTFWIEVDPAQFWKRSPIHWRIAYEKGVQYMGKGGRDATSFFRGLDNHTRYMRDEVVPALLGKRKRSNSEELLIKQVNAWLEAYKKIRKI